MAGRTTGGGLLNRLLLVLVGVVLLWLVVGWIVGFVFSLIRMLVFLVLFGVIAWVVLVGIGPPDE